MEPKEPPIAPGEPRLVRILEAAAVFVLGFAMMTYLYAASAPQRGAEIGVPGHDSFYHITMASMLPEVGLLKTFPWLQFTWFRETGDDFVSHHWGFHLLLMPFVKAGEWLKGDALAGGRWAICAIFGANLMLLHLLLRQQRVAWHWLWIVLALLLPDQFYARHAYVRAIGASLMFMQLTLLAMFAQRVWLAGLTIAAYVHLYLGAVFYGPVLVAVYAVAQLAGPRGDRVWPWKLVLVTAAGWLLGVLTYPYSSGMFEFLKVQVFGSGLSPDIEVGREWLPYTDAWFLVRIAAPLLAAWVVALVLRLRMGPRLNARESALLMLNFAFLLLTFKARRFIEYWPPMCLLSTATIATPPLRQLTSNVSAWLAARSGAARRTVHASAIAALAAGCVGVWRLLPGEPAAAGVVAEWRVWAMVVAALALPKLVRIWASGSSEGGAPPWGRIAAIAGCGLLAAAALGVSAAASFGFDLAPPRLSTPGIAWGLLIAVYAIAPLFAARPPAPARSAAILRTTYLLLAAVLLPAATIAGGAPTYASASGQMRCYYDLPATRAVMDFLREHSNPGDVIFTDDWDVFPLYFYHNRHNYYIVGLDPKFTHQRDPDLWSRYVRISRGQVPGTIRLASAKDGESLATVGLEDIREYFHARFVLIDRDHHRLAEALDRAPELAEFIYPGDSYDKARNAPYVLFRIRDRAESEAIAAANHTRATTGPVYLSDLRPISVSQGWGDLNADRSVDGNPLRLGGESYLRGLGTHAPAKLLYSIPEGSATFEAIVGVDDETGGSGSVIVAIELDGRQVYESPPLMGGDDPAIVSIPLDG
ncbi:MAG: hypothetical protein D6744_04375, partial [Planctomycetota bacterium]